MANDKRLSIVILIQKTIDKHLSLTILTNTGYWQTFVNGDFNV